MNDYADKQRPRAERLARMEGCTTFKDFREGFGSGWIDISDHDVMAALAMMRKGGDDIGAEVLQTYYGSTQSFRRGLVRAYLASYNDQPTDEKKRCRRMGATLAAQRVAGLSFTREQVEEYAWLMILRRQTLEVEMAQALAWFNGELDAAIGRFSRVFRDQHELAA